MVIITLSVNQLLVEGLVLFRRTLWYLTVDVKLHPEFEADSRRAQPLKTDRSSVKKRNVSNCLLVQHT